MKGEVGIGEWWNLNSTNQRVGPIVCGFNLTKTTIKVKGKSNTKNSTPFPPQRQWQLLSSWCSKEFDVFGKWNGENFLLLLLCLLVWCCFSNLVLGSHNLTVLIYRLLSTTVTELNAVIKNQPDSSSSDSRKPLFKSMSLQEIDESSSSSNNNVCRDPNCTWLFRSSHHYYTYFMSLFFIMPIEA